VNSILVGRHQQNHRAAKPIETLHHNGNTVGIKTKMLELPRQSPAAQLAQELRIILIINYY